MSKDQQPGDPNNRSGASTPSRETRRRLLKAAAGAPVVFTLPGGTALAATSLWCLENSMDRAREALPATLTHEPPNQGDWVRVEVPKLEYIRTVEVKDGDMVSYQELHTYGYRDRAGNWYWVEGERVDPDSDFDWQGPYRTGESYYLLADYPSADPIPHGSSRGTPIAGASCWNSLSALGFPTIN